MIRSMLRSFVVLVLLSATLVMGIFVGQTLPNLVPGLPPSEDHPRLVLRDALTEVSEMVVAEAAVKQTVTRELAGHLGGVFLWQYVEVGQLDSREDRGVRSADRRDTG